MSPKNLNIDKNWWVFECPTATERGKFGKAFQSKIYVTHWKSLLSIIIAVGEGVCIHHDASISSQETNITSFCKFNHEGPFLSLPFPFPFFSL